VRGLTACLQFARLPLPPALCLRVWPSALGLAQWLPTGQGIGPQSYAFLYLHPSLPSVAQASVPRAVKNTASGVVTARARGRNSRRAHQKATAPLARAPSCALWGLLRLWGFVSGLLARPFRCRHVPFFRFSLPFLSAWFRALVPALVVGAGVCCALRSGGFGLCLCAVAGPVVASAVRRVGRAARGCGVVRFRPSWPSAGAGVAMPPLRPLVLVSAVVCCPCGVFVPVRAVPVGNASVLVFCPACGAFFSVPRARFRPGSPGAVPAPVVQAALF
jgi:hypothetical protein